MNKLEQQTSNSNQHGCEIYRDTDFTEEEKASILAIFPDAVFISSELIPFDEAIKDWNI